MSYGDSTSSTSNSSGSGGTGSDVGGGGGKQGESSVIQHSIIGDLFAATGAMLYGLFTTIVKIKVGYLRHMLYYLSNTLNEVIVSYDRLSARFPVTKPCQPTWC